MLGFLHKTIALADAALYFAKFALWADGDDPLIIDLDGDGIETTQIGYGVFFDHNANLFAEETAWLKGDDGFLVRDVANDNAELGLRTAA
jgi:hypothetical protein